MLDNIFIFCFHEILNEKEFRFLLSNGVHNRNMSNKNQAQLIII